MPRKLTAKQLLAKFPAMVQRPCNENCLENMACPECGERDQFHIEMTTRFVLRDLGTDDHEDTEWDGHSSCQCGGCRHEGRARDFTFPGLDERIYQLQPDEAPQTA